MKMPRIIAVFMMVAALLFTFTACGGDTSTSDEGASSDQAAEVTVQEPATVESALPKIDTGATVDAMLGEWRDTADDTHFSKITKTDSGYQLEDNDGKYPATFKDGKLSVNVSGAEGDAAEAYIDTNTGHLFLLYQGGLTEFAKKQ